jgi:hypothetical protein
LKISQDDSSALQMVWVLSTFVNIRPSCSRSVIAPFYYQNLVGVLGPQKLVDVLAPQKQADGSLGWALPIDPDVRCIHMADVTEIGNMVAGAFAHPDEAGHRQYLPLSGDFMSFTEIVDTLNQQGHKFSFKQVPKEAFAALFRGAAEVAETFSLLPSLFVLRLGFV